MSIAPSEKINILIVDDSEDNLAMLEAALARDGVTIITTEIPTEAIKICNESDISIALIDVRMPKIDGFELLEKIKKNPATNHILVILITGYAINSEQVVKGLSKGAVDYLFKPLDLYITIAKVDSLITLVNYQREITRKNFELESYQAELIKAVEIAEKSRASKEIFLANMSHEIRTPLNSINGLTYLLKETTLNADQRELVRLMDYSSHALLGIVDDILESSKIDAGKINIVNSKTDLKTLIKTTCEVLFPMAKQKDLKLVCNIDAQVPDLLMADALRINQILMNLINNAIKFTPHGNVRVILQVTGRNKGKVKLSFTIRDTGVGIPSGSIDKIFNRFEQIEDNTWQKFGGTGLGLSIVKNLIDVMGGTLELNSEIDKGTEFIFSNWFDLGDHIPTKESGRLPSSLVKFKNVNVLLAEDNEVNQFLVVKMLENWDIHVDVACDGQEAFEKLKTKDYDLILMDTHMPVVDGLTATRMIRTMLTDKKRDIPIISFSASVTDHERAEARDSGVTDFIGKPFEPYVLHFRISSALNINTNKN